MGFGHGVSWISILTGFCMVSVKSRKGESALSGESEEVGGVLGEGLWSSVEAKVGSTCPVVVWGDSTCGDEGIALGHLSSMFHPYLSRLQLSFRTLSN